MKPAMISNQLNSDDAVLSRGKGSNVSLIQGDRLSNGTTSSNQGGV